MPTVEQLFSYPLAPHTRRHGPVGYVDYGAFKDWLRDEFQFRCVYCLHREMWELRLGSDAFSTDHFIPKKIHKDLATNYQNLVYCCMDCNSVKSDKIFSLDPTEMALGKHIRVKSTGEIEALTPEGHAMLDALAISGPKAALYRNRITELSCGSPWMLEYPSELPDLSQLRPPDGNTLQAGIDDSYYARKQRGDLPTTY